MHFDSFIILIYAPIRVDKGERSWSICLTFPRMRVGESAHVDYVIQVRIRYLHGRSTSEQWRHQSRKHWRRLAPVFASVARQLANLPTQGISVGGVAILLGAEGETSDEIRIFNAFFNASVLWLTSSGVAADHIVAWRRHKININRRLALYFVDVCPI